MGEIQAGCRVAVGVWVGGCGCGCGRGGWVWEGEVSTGQREVAVADELEDGVEVLVPARHLGRDGVRGRIA